MTGTGGPAAPLRPEPAPPDRPTTLTRFTPLMGLGMMAGPVLSMIDSSIVNVAVPDLVRELHRQLATVQWAISGYLLALAVGLAATSFLARRYGLLPTYIAALTLFTLASLGCSLAPGAAALIAFRALQGLCGAPMVPLAIGLLVGHGTAGAERGRMPVTAALAFFAAPALGAPAGGLLIGLFGWRSVFLVNVPIGLLALPGAIAVHRAGLGSPPDRRTPLDLPGLAMLGAGLGTVTYGVERATAYGWSDPWWPAGLALIILYVVWARTRPRPALDLHLVRDRARALTLAVCMVSSVVLFAVLFLAPLFLQSVQHHSATAAGLVLLPQGLAMGLSAPLGDRIVARTSVRAAVACGMALLAAMTGAMALFGATTPLWAITLVLCGRGMAIGLTTQPLVLSLLGGLPAARIPDANTLFSVAQRLAGSFGIALLATWFTARGRATGSALTGFHDAVLVLAAVAVAGGAAALLLRATEDGDREREGEREESQVNQVNGRDRGGPHVAGAATPPSAASEGPAGADPRL